MEIKIAGIDATPVASAQHRMSMLLWGQAGCGKTTLAATAPGKKLWLNFDDNGTASIAHRDDVLIVDFASQSDNIVTAFKSETERAIVSIDKALKENPDIETVVVDSMTSFGEKALAYGVRDASKFGSTLEDPGFKGYGRKNTWTRSMVKTLLRVTGKHGKHIVFICHEDVPTKDKEGQVAFISLMLGSNLSQEVPVDFSECWHMQDTGKARIIRVRPDSYFRPMKTRMFVTDGPTRFVWKYDPDTNEGQTLSGFFAEWADNGYKKLSVPT